MITGAAPEPETANVRIFDALLPFVSSQPPALLVFESQKTRLPTVLDPSNVTVQTALAGTSCAEKFATASVPEATELEAQFPAALQFPLPNFDHVPSAALAFCARGKTNDTGNARKQARSS